MYIVFDTETTGLPQRYNAPITDTNNWPRIVQLAWKVYDKDANEINSQDWIVKPDGFVIPQEAINIHQIDNERANGEGRPLREALLAFEKDIKRSMYLIAHNITFDEKIIGCELYRMGIDNYLYHCVHADTMSRAIINFCALPRRGGGFKFPGLGELYYKLFREGFVDAHNALADVAATAKCFFELQKLDIIGYKDVEEKEVDFSRFVSSFDECEKDGYKPLVNLSLHTFHSILEGAGSIDDYLKLAIEYNQPALAITDISTASGTFEFFQKCNEKGIKPIYGIEFYVNDNIERIKDPKAQSESYKIRLYAKNKKGYQSLNKLLYMANTDGYYNVGRIMLKWLYEHGESLIITTTGLEGKIGTLLQSGKVKDAEKHVLDFERKFGKKNIYLDIQLSHDAQQNAYNKFIINAANKYQLKILLSNNIYFATPEDRELQDVVTALKQKGSTLERAFLKDNEGLHFFSSEDYYKANTALGYNYPKEFIDICLKNTLEIAERCNFEFELGVEKFPKYEPTQDIIDYFKTSNTEEIIYKLAFAKLKQKLKFVKDRGIMEVDDEVRKKYHDQLTFELGVIKDKNMLDYFLVNWEIIRYYRSKGHDIGPARGCFLPDSKVKIKDGNLKPIQDIEIGDLVIDAFGDIRKVLDVLEYEIEEDIIELEFDDGRKIECTLDHEILTENRGWVQAKDLTEEDEVVEV